MKKPLKLFGIGILVLLILFVGGTFVIAWLQPAPPPVAMEHLLGPGLDPWEEGQAAYDAGDYERAVAYWRQVDPNHPEHTRALRFVGWEVYGRKLDQPAQGFRYVNQCLLANPLDGNAWQDLGRTYGAMLGF